MNEKLIKTQALYSLIDYEPFVILLSLVAFAYVFYKLFLRDASPERHRNLSNHFQNLLRHTILCSILFAVFKFIYQTDNLDWWLPRTLPYIALATFLWGSLVFVKTCRLITLQYLFLGSMKAGVPLLLVNIFSLMLSLSILLWGASYLFGIQLGPLLATSAAFSIILGLAMQDTLGNLFAGISLQLDRSFEIGDWLEVVSGTQKIIGQVKEITWRATIMSGWSDETITLPNRTMANSQISNFQSGDQPFLRSQVFRLALNCDTELVKKCLQEAIKNIPVIRKEPSPLFFISEMTDSWLGMKVAYYIDAYGSQFTIGDEVIIACMQALQKAGIEPAHQVYQLHGNRPVSPTQV
jgi:small-conductance mechanosensitive channel